MFQLFANLMMYQNSDMLGAKSDLIIGLPEKYKKITQFQFENDMVGKMKKFSFLFQLTQFVSRLIVFSTYQQGIII